MSGRNIRVGELIHREMSQILHRDYIDQAVRISLLEVSVSPDLRNGSVTYSVIGDEAERSRARKLFERIGGELCRKAARNVTLKYFPKMRFLLTESQEKANEVLQLLDELEAEDRE